MQTIGRIICQKIRNNLHLAELQQRNKIKLFVTFVYVKPLTCVCESNNQTHFLHLSSNISKCCLYRSSLSDCGRFRCLTAIQALHPFKTFNLCCDRGNDWVYNGKLFKRKETKITRPKTFLKDLFP